MKFSAKVTRQYNHKQDAWFTLMYYVCLKFLATDIKC